MRQALSVANDETTIELDAAPLLRVRRSLDLPSLQKPGTYVVELIAGGKASRALVRKGDLRYTTRPSAAEVEEQEYAIPRGEHIRGDARQGSLGG